MFTLFLCSCFRREKVDVPSKYPDVAWVSTNGVLELTHGETTGVFRDDEIYNVSLGFNNTGKYYYIYENKQGMPLMLSGNIKKTADMEFTLTVKEDNYFNFKYKEFVLIDKASITE